MFWVLGCASLLAACTSQPAQQENTTTTVTTKLDTLKQDSTAIPQDTVAVVQAAAVDSSVHQLACLLAGVPISDGSPLAQYKTPAWQKYATQADSNWAKYHRRQTTRMSNWATTELAQVRSQTNKIFYPFSGPDFLNVHTFFPDADTIMMIGLEPLGKLPPLETMSPDSANRLYPRVEKSLYSVLSFSFFQTISMAKDLKTQELNGTMPLITLFMARHNQMVLSARYIQLDADGNIQSIETENAEQGVRGTEIKYRKPDSDKVQVLYYYSVNLVDFKLKQNKPFLAYLNSAGKVTTYLKSASYLLHKSYFGTVAEFITSHSQYVLQDDSGMPLKYFKDEQWDKTFYGTYDKPIDMFARHYQADLRKAYHDSLAAPRKLPFGIGYDWRVNASNLMLFSKKQ